MNPSFCLTYAVDPALTWLVPLGIPRDHRARCMLLAAAGQETHYSARVQHGGGPAHGLWQFERGGGVAGVLSHPTTRTIARLACSVMLVAPVPSDVWMAIEHNDLLAAVFARLLLRCDPEPLPSSAGEGWATYLRCWRPGKPKPAAWADNWKDALASLEEVDGHA